MTDFIPLNDFDPFADEQPFNTNEEQETSFQYSFDDDDDEYEVSKTYQDLTKDLPEPPYAQDMDDFEEEDSQYLDLPTPTYAQDDEDSPLVREVKQFYRKMIETEGVNTEGIYFQSCDNFELEDGKLRIKGFPSVNLYWEKKPRKVFILLYN